MNSTPIQWSGQKQYLGNLMFQFVISNGLLVIVIFHLFLCRQLIGLTEGAIINKIKTLNIFITKVL